MELLIGTPPPARRQGWRVGRDSGLHAGGEEQGTDRCPALQAGVHLMEAWIQSCILLAPTKAAENKIWPVSRPWEAAAPGTRRRVVMKL